MAGIVCAGNWILDHVKMIDCWPKKGELANILSESKGAGGAPFNIMLGFSKLGVNFPTWGIGCVGNDPFGQEILEICRRAQLDVQWLNVLNDASTSYTDVMTLQETGERTFFHHRGANAKFSPRHVPLDSLKEVGVQIFHLGYLMLLDEMDKTDPEDGIVAAGLLQQIQTLGIETSIDLVSESSDRYIQIVHPCLKYVDHCIINEVEASNVTQFELRKSDNQLDHDKVFDAAKELLDLGVQQTAVIHFPEGSVWVDRLGNSIFQSSLDIPQDRIVSTVGAGDAFCAGVLWGLHEKWSPQKTMEMASGIAAACLQGINTTDGIGSQAMIVDLIQQFKHP